MMTVTPHFSQDSNHQTSSRLTREQTSQKTTPPVLGRLVLLAAAITVWGAVGLALSHAVQAQTRPYPPYRGGSGAGPENSESIAELQRHLADLGYFNGEITGYLGPQTQEAIVRFQQDMGLAADGIVGPETARMLFQGGPSGAQSYDESPDPEVRGGVRLEDSGDQVAALQQRLADLGYYSGEISGDFDYPTEAAVMQFQRDNGLETDGVVGPNTEDMLRRPTEEIMRPAEAARSGEAPRSEVETSDPQASNFVSPDQPDNLLRVGDSGQAVSELQSRLQGLGFYQGELTGLYDPETEAAVIAFQQSQGLDVDGIAGPQVNSALYNPVNLTAANSPATTATGGIPGSASPSVTAATPAGMAQQPAQAPADVEQLRLQAEQARLEAEQAKLDAEQARMMLDQNFSEGRYSVAELQRRLRDEGIYPGEVNGLLDSGTQSAIVEAQRKHGLSQSDLHGSTAVPAAPAF